MPAAASFAAFQTELGRLVEVFGRHLHHYKSAGYDEASLRNEFLNPFFRALGWDVENLAGHIPKHREVEIESRTKIGGRQKRADYLFRTDTRERFICEAKKPAEELQARYAFQAKRYAWNMGLPVAVLTDFEEFKIYVVGGKPQFDEPDMGLWKTYGYQQLPLVAQELWELLSRDRVAGGSIDKLIESLPKKPAGKGKARQQWLIRPDRTRSLDTDFLNFLDEARRELATDLLNQNDREDLCEGTRLNEAVQHILDRLLFLRICEDRDIDTGIRLDSILQTWRKKTGHDDEGRRAHQHPLELREEPPAQHGGSGLKAPRGSLWHAVIRHFRALDRRPPSHVPWFNGNLFKPHFSEALMLSDEWIAGFLADLSAEESPYLFSVIPVEILGTIYERFLGKVVRPHGRGAVIEEKPEVRKAGGVYYTPKYIVDYIVEQTVGKLLEGKKPEATLKLRVLDPACGSGSFLLGAYERVCDHWQAWLTKNLEERKKKWCWVEKIREEVVEPGGARKEIVRETVNLTASLKRHILVENIYGVDLDPGAVEVTQLSLYLKMLESENRETLKRERDLFPEDDEPLLPPLENNIKCGNSLIASDFSMIPEDLVRVRAFDWPVGFPTIMKAGGFDGVIGNPPYIRIQGFQADQVAYFVKNYRAATGNYDIYVNFLERGLKLLSKSGRLGMIIPNKFFRTDYGLGLRSFLSEQRAVSGIVDFGAEQVFEATTYTCLLFLSNEGNATFNYTTSKADEKFLGKAAFHQRPNDSLTSKAWTFADEPQTRLLQKLRSAGVRLLDLPADMSRGSSTGDDDLFIVEAGAHRLEKGALRTPLFASDFGRYQFEPSDKWQIIFPYIAERGEFRPLSSSELQKKFPKAFAHLQGNEWRLRERKQFREWFGYSAPRNLELHDRAQIAVPLLANGGLCALIPKSSRGKVCPMASGGFTITLNDTCRLKPEFVLGILNSRLAFWFLGQISNVFRGGWITCTKQYFGELPIARLNLSNPAEKAHHDKLVMLVEKMLGLMPKLREATSDTQKGTLNNAVTATEQQIDQLVFELYGLTQEEIALVESQEPK